MVEGIDAISKNSDTNLRAIVDEIAILTAKAQQLSNVRPVEKSSESSADNSSSNGRSPTPEDTVEITETAVSIADSGVERSQSKVVPTSDGVNFNLKFNDGPRGPIIAKGSYSASDEKFDIFLSFSFEDNNKVGDEIETRTLSANIKLSAKASPEVFANTDTHYPTVKARSNEFIDNVTRSALGKLSTPPGAVVIELDPLTALVSDSSSPVFRRVAISLPLVNEQVLPPISSDDGDSKRAIPVQDETLGSVLPKKTKDTESIKDVSASVQLIDITPPRVRSEAPPTSISGQSNNGGAEQ